MFWCLLRESIKHFFEMPPGLTEDGVTNNYTSHLPDGIHSNNNTKNNHVVLRKLTLGNMSLDTKERKSAILCGVIAFTDDKLCKTVESSENILLGSICVDDDKMKLDDLRRLMCEEVPALPESFVFFSKEGWPLLKKQECVLRASHVISASSTICIKKQFEKQRFGVVLSGGDPLGFVFADINNDARQLREIIEQQLKMSQQLKMEYRFIERNGWPVMPSQEQLLSLLDIMLGHVIYIQRYEKAAETIFNPTRPTSITFNNNNNTAISDGHSPTGQEAADNEAVQRKKSLKFLRPETQLSLKGRKESQKRMKIGKENIDLAKPILISYVRAEAAQYALDLKQELVYRGYSVYLDVHEIKTGSDWQDSLNFAVTHCFLFVPLITRMYGKTQWTNREIKLADVLGKLIVPVNFMDHWPPACLAIQFASTQYIPWKIQETEHLKGEVEKTHDPRIWPKHHLERVSTLIEECYKENSGPALLKRQPSANRLQIQPKARCYALSSVRDEYCAPTPVLYDEPFEELKHNIVISAHTKQWQLTQELKFLFEKEGYLVWCSNKGQEGCDSVGSDDKVSMPNTPRDLPTISEGEVFFSQHERDVVFSTYEGSKKLSPTSKDVEPFGRRPLSRLMSQFTDISQPSTLSPEKLERLRIFQQKVDQAGVVVVLVSEDYSKSTFSHQQVFYCEQRKRVVLVKCDDSTVPKWFRLLMGNDMIMATDNPQFHCVLKARVKRALNPSSSETPKDATFEAKINYLVNFLKCNLPLKDMRVYITGSSKLQTRRAEEICRAIGQELSKVPNMSLVTGGFYGAPDIAAKSFYEQRESSTQSYVDDSAVVHILPIHEAEDLKSKARQNLDGSFEVIPYGKTFFVGDSLKERETVVARLLDMCIVIEGGPGVVHEIEEFIWNDHFVIPVHSTGGAAGGKYGIPMKIFELPPGVDAADWSVLSEQEATPEDVAKAVVNILFSLKKAVSSPTNTLKSPGFLNRKQKKKAKETISNRLFWKR